ncbi:MAG: hypothetical protein RL304_975 [Verrucomicrobiota bacterium]|jgi:hypothetical protein
MLLAVAGLLAAENAPEPTFAEVNKALGLELLVDDNLWDDEAKAVADRLDWPEESATKSDASYRLYPPERQRLLGCRPYSCAFLAEQGKPWSLSLMFANKGDAVTISSKEAKDPAKIRAREAQIKDFKKVIQEDAQALAARLTELLGKPVADKLGQGRRMSESARRWDWKGHAFLLVSPKDEYVALRILSTRTADEGGRTRISDADLMARAKANVERRPNGDVVIKEIPMVNQGPKGYCVPATWERVMRYMGIPADMYVLAMVGQSGAGGGTSLTALAAGARETVLAAGRKLETASFKPEPALVAKYIDRGLPIIWSMSSTDEYNKLADERTRARGQAADGPAWKKTLAEGRKGQKPLKAEREKGHVCMIIGYNKETGEVAVSDSWGAHFEERWILGVEATQVSQGEMMVIGF